MGMAVVQIRRVRMGMSQGWVPMFMTMCASRHWIVAVMVVSIIVSMRVLVRDRLMLMIMFMPFEQMECDARCHQHRATCQPATEATLP